MTFKGLVNGPLVVHDGPLTIYIIHISISNKVNFNYHMYIFFSITYIFVFLCFFFPFKYAFHIAYERKKRDKIFPI